MKRVNHLLQKNTPIIIIAQLYASMVNAVIVCLSVHPSICLSQVRVLL